MDTVYRKISNVQKIGITKKHLIILFENKLLICNYNSEIKHVINFDNQKALDLFIRGQNAIINFQESKGAMILSDNLMVYNLGSAVLNFFESIFLMLERKNNLKNMFCYKLSGELLWSRQGVSLITMCCKNKIFLTDGLRKDINYPHTGLIALGSNNGDKLWDYIIPKRLDYDIGFSRSNYVPDTIVKILCVYEDVVWFILASGKLLGVDVNTGELEFEIDNKYGINNPFSDSGFFGSQTTKYMEQEQKIVSISKRAYTEFDLRTKKHYIYPIEFPEGFESEIIEYSESIDDRYLYFSRGMIYPLYGAYDRKEKKIAFIDSFTNDKGEPAGVKGFQANRDYLYILERNGPLYIYKNPLEY